MVSAPRSASKSVRWHNFHGLNHRTSSSNALIRQSNVLIWILFTLAILCLLPELYTRGCVRVPDHYWDPTFFFNLQRQPLFQIFFRNSCIRNRPFCWRWRQQKNVWMCLSLFLNMCHEQVVIKEFLNNTNNILKRWPRAVSRITQKNGKPIIYFLKVGLLHAYTAVPFKNGHTVSLWASEPTWSWILALSARWKSSFAKTDISKRKSELLVYLKETTIFKQRMKNWKDDLSRPR